MKAKVDLSVEAIQTHNAKDAIKVSWEKDVTIAEDGTLTFI